MPGAGTDKTKNWIEQPGPIVVLVEPQLGENIGAAARAMANFGLARLRLVNPRQGWPNKKANMMAVGADRVLDNAELYESAAAAIADCHFVLATTARISWARSTGVRAGVCSISDIPPYPLHFLIGRRHRKSGDTILQVESAAISGVCQAPAQLDRPGVE